MPSETIPEFFIIGTQRSGTTLLRLLINNHQDICLPEEATFLMPLLKRRALEKNKYLKPNKKKKLIQYIQSNYQYKKWNLPEGALNRFTDSDLSHQQLIQLCYQAYLEFCKKHRIGDKTPSFFRKINVLRILNKDAKFIFVVRDPRDVYLSLLRQKHHSIKNVALFAIEWNFKQRTITKQLNAINPKQVHILRYEDLIESPAAAIRDICSFLEVEYEPEMLNFWQNSQKFIDSEHSDKIFKPVDKANKYKWKQVLKESDLQIFSHFSGKMLQQFNYELTSVSVSFPKRMSWFFQLMIAVPQRLFRVFSTAVGMKLLSILGFSATKKYYE